MENQTLPPPPPPPILRVDPITAIGPIFIGNSFNWLLLGTLGMQTYNYWRKYPTDHTWLKALVYLIFLADIIQTGFGTHESWWYAIANWGNPSSLQQGPWTALLTPIFCGLISGAVQIFYAFRIWRFKSHAFAKAAAVLVILLALLQSLAAIVADCLLWKDLSQENLLRLHPLFLVWLSVSFITDILIAASMILILQTSKIRSPVSRMDTVIQRLMVNTVQTGMVTVICAGATLALFVKYTDKNYYHVFVAFLGKLYSNSFMASLNSRARRRTPGDAEAFTLRSSGNHARAIETVSFAPHISSSTKATSTTDDTELGSADAAKHSAGASSGAE